MAVPIQKVSNLGDGKAAPRDPPEALVKAIHELLGPQADSSVPLSACFEQALLKYGGTDVVGEMDPPAHCACGRPIRNCVFVQVEGGKELAIGMTCANRFMPKETVRMAEDELRVAKGTHKVCTRCKYTIPLAKMDGERCIGCATRRTCVEPGCERVFASKDETRKWCTQHAKLHPAAEVTEATVMRTGKHRGRTFGEILTEDQRYCAWLLARAEENVRRVNTPFECWLKREWNAGRWRVGFGKHKAITYREALEWPSYCVWASKNLVGGRAKVAPLQHSFVKWLASHQ